MKPLFIVPCPGEEIWSCGGFLANFWNHLQNQAETEDTIIDIRDKARIMYAIMADNNNPQTNYYTALTNQVDTIKSNANYLGYTWESIYWGRKNHNKLVGLEKTELKSKVKDRIKFYKPTDIFVQTPINWKNNTDEAVLFRVVVDLLFYDIKNVNLYGFCFENLHGLYKQYSNKDHKLKQMMTDSYWDLFRNKSRHRNQIDLRNKRFGEVIGKNYAEIFTPIKVKLINNL